MDSKTMNDRPIALSIEQVNRLWGVHENLERIKNRYPDDWPSTIVDHLADMRRCLDEKSWDEMSFHCLQLETWLAVLTDPLSQARIAQAEFSKKQQLQ